MKIRTDFVTNSSSSSWVCIKTECEIMDNGKKGSFGKMIEKACDTGAGAPQLSEYNTTTENLVNIFTGCCIFNGGDFDSDEWEDYKSYADKKNIEQVEKMLELETNINNTMKGMIYTIELFEDEFVLEYYEVGGYEHERIYLEMENKVVKKYKYRGEDREKRKLVVSGPEEIFNLPEEVKATVQRFIDVYFN